MEHLKNTTIHKDSYTPYTYLLLFPNGMKYHGSSYKEGASPDEHYWGSSKHLPENTSEVATKFILTIHKTKEEAISAEVLYHAKYDVKTNKEFYNKANQTSYGFSYSLKGETKHTNQGLKTRSKKLEGRTKENNAGRRAQAISLSKTWENPTCKMLAHVANTKKRMTGEGNHMFGRLPNENPSFDKTIYSFYHSDYGTRRCTQYALRQEFNLKPAGISGLIHKIRGAKSHKGWIIKEDL